MEEAPLIMKKGAQNDKCGSCNQVVPHNHNLNSTQTNYNGKNALSSLTTTEDNSRYKLRAIQDISNKFGIGSYSRILNNINTDTLNEDLKTNNKNSLSNSVNLPNIKMKSSVNSPRRKNLSLIKIDEINEKNEMNDDGIEKKLINDNLTIKKEKKK